MKPGDFFLGVTDFFSILLPGAGVAFIGKFWAERILIPSDHMLAGVLRLQDAAAWTAFAVISYVLGHVIASIGAYLDPLYETRKAKQRNDALRHLVDSRLDRFLSEESLVHAPPVDRAHEPTEPRLFARLIDGLFLWGAWAKRPREDRPARASKAINAYKLARLVLNHRAPSLFAEVARLEADSKFFRSLVVVAAFTTVASAAQLIKDVIRYALGSATYAVPLWGLAYLAFVFVVLRVAFARYCELRLKATETAFQGMLVVTRPTSSTPPAGPGSEPAAPT
jgi:hypothetical protein